MKTLSSFVAVLLLAGARLHAEVSPISVRAESVTKSENGKIEHTQVVSLKIIVSNGSLTDLTQLTAKYFYFGKDVSDHETSILEKGERGLDVKAHSTETIEAPAFTAKRTEAHSEGGKGGKGAKPGKKVEASGNHVSGYGVQIFQSGKLLNDYYSSPGMKAIVESKK